MSSKHKKSAKQAVRKKAAAKERDYTAIIFFTIVILIGAIAAGISLLGDKTPEETGTPALDAAKTYYADIVIQEYGSITVQLDQSAAPVTAANFVSLAQSGFYNGLTFHRIIEGFMMQGGAPASQQTAAASIVGEFTSNGYSNPLKHERGVISMARTSDPNSASSQFFIMQATKTHLDGEYAAFGRVISGMEVVDAICSAAQPTDGNGTIAQSDQPVITSITIRVEG